jgi:hypothetical protein
MATKTPTQAAGGMPYALLLAGAALWWFSRRKPAATPNATPAAAGENRYLQPIQAGEDPYTRRKSDMTAQLSTGWTNPTPGGI